ncbi:hypothetical protein TNCT_366361 [Trichonephila clavata]|uniref:Uncharacterized protein n=1 Tax=Trichonephila clavata TaxID=2740835 RepID=A0A8X6F9X7_TRICU|nr:hypothetical protein TNCT_366361 [Trichonephila clavata]
MTNLGLKTLNVVPYYCHQMLPMMWETLNTISLSIYRTMCESGHLISNFLSCCEPLPRIGSLILGMISKSQGEMYGGWCSKSSHPQRRSSCYPHSALCDLALSCRMFAQSTRSERIS